MPKGQQVPLNTARTYTRHVAFADSIERRSRILKGVHAAQWPRPLPAPPPQARAWAAEGLTPRSPLSPTEFTMSDFKAWLQDFAIGGLTGAITKTATAPIERVKLLIQTQDANPLIRSGAAGLGIDAGGSSLTATVP